MDKKFNGFRWALFVPLQIILSVIILLLIKWIPIVQIVSVLFDINDNNPLITKIVNGPIGFFLVYILYGLALIISSMIAIGITSKPKLAWKILWTIQLMPIFIFILIFEITGKNFFNGNYWFNIAQSSSIITAAFITYYFIRDEN